MRGQHFWKVSFLLSQPPTREKKEKGCCGHPQRLLREIRVSLSQPPSAPPFPDRTEREREIETAHERDREKKKEPATNKLLLYPDPSPEDSAHSTPERGNVSIDRERISTLCHFAPTSRTTLLNK